MSKPRELFDVYVLRGFVVMGDWQVVLTPRHALALSNQLRGYALAELDLDARDRLMVPVGASEYLSYLASNHKKG